MNARLAALLTMLVLANPLTVSAPAVARAAPAAGPAQIAARFVADFAAQRAAPIAAYTARDAAMIVLFTPSGPQTLRGRDATTAYFTALFAKYARIDLTGVTITPSADGRTVFVEALARYTDRAGASHEVGNVWVMEVRRGSIVASRSYAIPASPPPTR